MISFISYHGSHDTVSLAMFIVAKHDRGIIGLHDLLNQ